MPTITRCRAPAPVTFGPDGPHFTAEWAVEAGSEMHALTLLRDLLGVGRGWVYVDENGGIPDDSVRCHMITVRGAPPAPNGGVGLYRVTAECSRGAFVHKEVATISGGVVYRIEGSVASEPVDVDVYGAPIMNRAHEPIDPPLMMQVVRKVLVREWITMKSTWEQAYTRLAAFEGCVNSQPYRGAPIGSLWCEPVIVEDAGQEGTPSAFNLNSLRAFRCIMRFQYRPPKRVIQHPGSGVHIDVEGWDEVFWERARRKYIGGQPPNMVYKPFRMDGDSGPIVTEPVPLNNLGDPWKSGDVRAIKVVRLYPRIDFNSIPND